MRFASRTQPASDNQYSAWETHFIAAEKIARGEEAILLTVGDTDFPSPASAVAAAHAAMKAGRTHYTASYGEKALREAIAARHSAQTGQQTAASQVIVTIGAQNALFTTALCIVDPGDEVIVPEPMYTTYPGTIGAAGGVTIQAPSPPENGFLPLIEGIEAAITPKTRAVFLATPNNPTGTVYTRDVLAAIGALCERHDLWLVSDEVYGDLVHEGTHISPAALPGLAARTITIGSLSKSHAMAGWRLGWMIAPPELAERAQELTGCSTYGIPTFLQDAAVAALKEYPQGVPALKDAYRQRRDRFCAALDAVPGLRCHKPAGGMFVMVDVRGTGVSARDFAIGLVHDESVAVLPADGFGPSAAGYLRVNLGVRDDLLDEAVRRIARYAAGLASRAAE